MLLAPFSAIKCTCKPLRQSVSASEVGLAMPRDTRTPLVYVCCQILTLAYFLETVADNSNWSLQAGTAFML